MEQTIDTAKALMAALDEQAYETFCAADSDAWLKALTMYSDYNEYFWDMLYDERHS